MKVLLRPALWMLLIAAAMSPAAHAAWNWPWKDSAKSRHTAKTLHANVQHPVRPLGNAGKRVVKPLGGTRPIGKTILAKRPP
ncbi:MAG TPA: hypothetical protein VII17_03545 [Steroidobacteraceae bacterium]